jgi:DegV family protein with EDD domain
VPATSTAAPSAGRFEAAFRDLAEQGATGVVCVSLSAEVSATLGSASLAATAVADEIPVRVVDSRFVSMGVGLLALDAARRAARGESMDAITEAVEAARNRLRLYATLDTLEFLKRGGRIGGAKAMLGSLLSVKPIIEVRDGRVEEAGKVRTRTKALHAIVDKVTAQPVDQVVVIGGDAPDRDALVTMIQPHIGDAELFVGEIGPVVGTHAGPGVVGVVFRVAD